MQLFGGGDELAHKGDIPMPNLLEGSHDFSGNKWLLADSSSKLTIQDANMTDPNGNKVALYNWIWNGITQNIYCSFGELLTIGSYLKLAENNKNPVYVLGTSTNGGENTFVKATVGGQTLEQLQDNAIIQANSNNASNWQWCTATYSITKSGIFQPRFESNIDSSQVYIGSPIVVKSDGIDHWYPNLNDFAYKSDLENLQNQINQFKK